MDLRERGRRMKKWKKWFDLVAVVGLCALALCACSNSKSAEELDKWDCSVVCAKESEDGYVITYSDEEVVPQAGVLTFQNRNEFDIVVHLLTAGEEERTMEISAGGICVQDQLKTGAAYTVGCHAEVEENTEIKLMVYDGEGTEMYWSEN